jgi:hypothetical protein
MRTNMLALFLVALATLVFPRLGLATIEVDGVMGLTPATEGSCLALEITLDPGASLTGLRWFHNDGMIAFPELLLMEGLPGTPPDLAETGMILEQLGAQSLTWGEAVLEQPVTSTTGTIHAVFVFPGLEKTGKGVHGGPAVGYWNATGQAQAYVSPDGVNWASVHPAMQVAIEPMMGQLKAAGVPLSALKGNVADSDWEWPGATDEGQKNGADSAPSLTVSPNPFNPQTEIRFYLPEAGEVYLDVYNVRGQQLSRLLHEVRAAGDHQIVWRGSDARGRAVASGVYLIRLEAMGQTTEKRVVLLR